MIENETDPTEEMVETPDESPPDHENGVSPEEPEEAVASSEEPEEQPTVQQQRFKDLREAKKKAEREARLLKEEILAIRKDIDSLKPQPVEPEDDYGISDNDLVEGKKFKEVAKTTKRLEKEINAYKQQQSISRAFAEADRELASENEDYFSVITQQNINKFREAYPEMAEGILSISDPYKLGKSLYASIKNLGLNRPDMYKEQRQRAQVNSKKPRPLSSGGAQQGETPLAKANAFAKGGYGDITDDMIEQRKREMSNQTPYFTEEEHW